MDKWTKQDRIRRRYEAKLYKALYKWINDDLRILKKESPEIALAKLPTLFAWEKLSTILQANYEQMGQRSGTDAYANVANDGTSIKRGVDFISTIVQAIIRRIAGSRLLAAEIRNIPDNLRSEVRAILSNTVGEVLGAREIASRLSAKFARDRALRIARTETTYMWNIAAEEGAKATGLRLEKVWLATNDARTRDTHRQLDGQVVPVDADFVVNGKQMSKPGDPRGGAREVVNCRCAVEYRRVT